MTADNLPQQQPQLITDLSGHNSYGDEA